MTFIIFSSKSFLLTVPGCIIPGFVIFFTLTYLLVPTRITIPASIIFSALVLGLTNYYGAKTIVVDSSNHNDNDRGRYAVDKKLRSKQYHSRAPSNHQYTSDQSSTSNFAIFLTLFIICLLIALISNPNSELFISWNKITPVQIIQLAAAIALSFFLPGYALVTIVDKKHELQLLPKVLLGYIFSMLVTGLTAYIMASAGYAVSDVKMLFLGIYAVLLAVSFLLYFENKNRILSHSSAKITSRLPGWLSRPYRQHFLELCKRSLDRVVTNSSLCIVFLSLFGLVVLFTYHLYEGKIVGDQWFHLGRSMLFTSGNYGEVIDYDVDTIYPPFFSALLAAFSTLAGVPSVNAYASIHFLNIMPVFAFYYFFTKWVPTRWKKAALMASVLFVLSSGFGWIHVLDRALEGGTEMSPEFSLTTLQSGGLKTSDVRSPTTFVNVGHPDFSTPLLVAALPAGFTLLGLGKDKSFRNYVYLIIVTGISYFGIAFHDEFYFFIIIASILPLAFNFKQRNSLYAALLTSISFIVLTDILSPGKYFTVREILGFPLVAHVFVFVLLVWTLYYTRVLHNMLLWQKKGIAWMVKKLKARIPGKLKNQGNYNHSSTIRFSLRVLTVSAVVYLYLFTFLVWGELSERDVRIQTRDFGQSDVPWYLYPMKFGLTGLLGLAFLLSYIFKKYEMEVFVFGIIALSALITGPYYQEHRFSKYIMSAMAGFASLLIYRIIGLLSGYPLTRLFYGVLIGSIITISSLSIVFFLGYNALGLENPHLEIALSKRDFPSSSELKLLDFLRKDHLNDIGTSNVAIPSDEYDLQRGFIPKLEGFSSFPRVKLLESQYTLNASTIEAFYDFIKYADINYILMPTDQTGVEEKLPYPIRFALNNFQKAYGDDYYTVLTVPANLAPASERGKADVALVYKANDKILVLPQSPSSSSSSKSSTKVLSYNNESFRELEKESEFVKTDTINNNTNSTTAILYGDRKKSGGITLWSNPLSFEKGKTHLNNGNTSNGKTNGSINGTADDMNTSINYIQAKFRIIDDSITKKNHDAGIKWTDERKNEYYAALRNDKLELELDLEEDNTANSSSKEDGQNNNNNRHYFFQNQEIRIEKGIWYTLAVVIAQKTINLYVDNILAIKAPRVLLHDPESIKSTSYNDNNEYNNNITKTADNVSRVGIRSFHNTAEFQPVVVGNLSSPEIIQDSVNYQKEVYNHYYPVSMLALSDRKYETFVYGDYSALSKRYVILPLDPTYEFNQHDEENSLSAYLEYVDSGGNLVVIHSDKNCNDIFSNLLSIDPAHVMKFDSMEDYDTRKEEQLFVNVSGFVRDIKIANSWEDNNNLFINSFCSHSGNNGNQTTPFVIEKKYGEGRIILVNAGGYFDALFNDSNRSFSNQNSSKSFQSLAIIPYKIGLNPFDKNNDSAGQDNDDSTPSARFIGHLEILSKDILLKSSSLLLPNRSDSYDVYIEEINYKPPLQKNVPVSHNTIDKSQLEQIGQHHGMPSNKFKDVILKDLKLRGKYDIVINSTSAEGMNLPSFPSNYDYFTIPIQGAFDMKIKLGHDSCRSVLTAGGTANSDDDCYSNNKKINTFAVADIIISNNSNNTVQNIRLTGGEIIFHNIKSKVNNGETTISSSSEHSLNNTLPLIIKSPEITIINGTARFDKLHDPDRLWETLSFPPVEVSGQNMTLKLNHVDYNHEPYGKFGIKTDYITFFNWVKDIDRGNNNDDKHSVKFTYEGREGQGIQIPADISEIAKSKGIGVPWEKAVTSLNSLILLIAIVVGALLTIAIYYIRKRKELPGGK